MKVQCQQKYYNSNCGIKLIANSMLAYKAGKWNYREITLEFIHCKFTV